MGARAIHRLVLVASACGVFVLSAALCIFIEKYLLAEERSVATQAADRMARQLELQLDQSLFPTYALAALVQQGSGHVGNFEGIASAFLALHPGVSALQLAPEGVVRATMPLVGNEKAIGHDLLSDGKRSKEARIAVETRRLTLAGPFELIQGGVAVVGRLPVFLEQRGGAFWGFSIAVIRLPDLLKVARLDELDRLGYAYELWRTHPDSGDRHVFARSSADLSGPAATSTIDVPNGRWFISVVPVSGWLNWPRIVGEAILVLLIAMAVCAAVHEYLSAHEALAESESRYRGLYEATPAMLHSIDVEGRIVSVSDQWLKVLGYARAEVIGRKSSEFLTEESRRHAIEAVLPEFFRTGYCSDVSYQMVAKDGRILDVLLSAYGQRDANGQVVRSLAVIQDVTERKRDQQRVERLLTEQKAMLENDLVGIVRVKNRTIVWANPAFEKMLGYGSGELNGTPTRQNYPSEDAYEALGAEAYAVLQDGKIYRSKIEHVRKDGARIWLDISGATLNHGSGESLWAFVDVTERQRLEETTVESRHRMQALLDASPESTLLLEPDGKLLAINAVGAERFGQTPQQMIGKNFFDYIPQDIASTRREALRQVVATGEPMRLQDRRGGIEFENSICPVTDEQGGVTSVAVYARDITEQQLGQRLDGIFHRLDMMQLQWQMDLTAIAQMFCEEVRSLFDLEVVWIGKANADGRLDFTGAAERPGIDIVHALRERGQRWDEDPSCCTLAGIVLRTGQLQRRAFSDLECEPCRQAMQSVGIEAILMLPLILRGKIWGVMALYTHDRKQFDRVDLPPRFTAIGSRLSVSLESSQQQEWLTLMDTALSSVGNAVFVTDADGRIQWANPSFERLSGFAAKEIIGGTPRLFHSGAQDQAFYAQFWSKIRGGETWRGEFINARRDGSRYTVSETVTPLRNSAGDISHFVSIQEDITDRKASEEKIRHLANFDALTDLPNRVLFFEKLNETLARAKRYGHLGALLFLDLDRFKEVNDQFGHHVGDQLLREVAARLQMEVRGTDFVARLAGDEFTVTLPQITQVSDALHVGSKIVSALSREFELEDRVINIGVSIGIALFPEHGDNGEQILNAADNAMYEAKRAGRNTMRVYGA